MADDKVVNFPSKDAEPIPLKFRVGPGTIKEDITPYESAMLTMFIIRAAGQTMLESDLHMYPDSMLRHIVFEKT